MDTIDFDHHAEAIGRDGYTVIPDVFDAECSMHILGRIDSLYPDLGTTPASNEFEGSATYRIYNLLIHGDAFTPIPTDPSVLPLVERVLDAGCLLSSLSSIDIRPGETAQPIHADDQLMPLPKPHPPTVCNTMWALTDFTEANGATRVVPGSHLADDSPPYGEAVDSVPAEMRAGSVLVWHGSLWHGGGANRTDERRVGIASNYCAGYIRQQENQQLGVPRSVAAGFERRLQELMGYTTYNMLIGHINKRAPIELLDAEADATMIWDLA